MRWIFLLLLLTNLVVFALQPRPVSRLSSELSLVAPSAEQLTVRGLQLVTEVPSKGGEIADSPSLNSCIVLGGFEALETARQLEQHLLSLDIEGRVVSTEVAFDSDHWVYLPSLASRQASLRLLRELQARGVDSFLITEGELVNGILLGVFSRASDAMTVAEKLRAAGYEPEVRVVPRIYQEYWVQLAMKERHLLSHELQASLAAAFPHLKHQLISCSGVAYPK